MKLVAALAGVVLMLAVAPGVARADGDDDDNDVDAPPPNVDDNWHGDAMPIADIPLAASNFRSVTSFGGGLELRVYKGLLDLAFENVLFAGQDSMLDERVRYRSRLLGGVRVSKGLTSNRAVVGRLDGGLEVAGFDPVGSSTFVAAHHRLGFSLEVSGESRSQLDWGVITISLGLALSEQPFAKKGAEQVNYFGVELIAGASVGF